MVTPNILKDVLQDINNSNENLDDQSYLSEENLKSSNEQSLSSESLIQLK